MTRRRAGEARSRGKLDVAGGRFALRPDLTAPGAISVSDAADLVMADWDRQATAGTVSAGLIKNYKIALRSLVRFATARSIREVRAMTSTLIFEWMHAASATGKTPAHNTRLLRRSTAKAFFQTCTCLRLHDANPAASVAETKRQHRYVHAFTDGQMRQLRDCAPFQIRETKTPAALALVSLGATTREAGFVQVRDVDLVARQVWVHDGGERSTPRFLPIDDDWAAEAIAHRITALASAQPDAAALADAFLVVESRSAKPDPAAQQSAVTMTLTKLLKLARVYEPGITRVESIREWRAARVFAETGRVEAVATRLGMASLDGAAHLVGYDWQSAYRLQPAVTGGDVS